LSRLKNIIELSCNEIGLLFFYGTASEVENEILSYQKNNDVAFPCCTLFSKRNIDSGDFLDTYNDVKLLLLDNTSEKNTSTENDAIFASLKVLDKALFTKIANSNYISGAHESLIERAIDDDFIRVGPDLKCKREITVDLIISKC